MNEKQPRRHVVAPIVLFAITATVAVVMLLAALVVWLAEVTGSMIWATLIVGGFFALVATILYFASVQGAIRHIRNQVDTIYEMAQIVHTGYKWATEKFNSILCLVLTNLLRKL